MHAVVRDTGQPDPIARDAGQVPIEDLPDDALVFLLASRFCESDKLLDTSWQLFGKARPGWDRVQAICDFVHNHIKFDYAKARPTRTASEGYTKRVGVVPRLRPSGDRVLPCSQYSCTRKQTRVHLIQSPHRRGQ